MTVVEVVEGFWRIYQMKPRPMPRFAPVTNEVCCVELKIKRRMLVVIERGWIEYEGCVNSGSEVPRC